MTMLLPQIRRIIGKNTKFKQVKSRNSKIIKKVLCFLQNLVPSGFLFVSFTIAAFVFPVVGSGSSISSVSRLPEKDKLVISVDLNSELEYESWSQDQFAGGKVPSSFERLSIDRIHDGNEDTGFQQSVKNFIRKHVNKYKISVGEVHSHLEEERDEQVSKATENDKDFWSDGRNRSRRAVIWQETIPNLPRTRRKTVNHESEGTFVINQLNRATPQFYDNASAIDINVQRVKDKSFVFSIETTKQGREVRMYQINEKNLGQTLLLSTKAPDAVSVDVFKVKDDVFAFTTVNHKPQVAGSTETINTGSILYRINFVSNSFEKTQTIHLPFAKSNAFWTGMGEEANEIFLALAPEKTVINAEKTSFSVMVPLYRWQGGYFDYISELPASNPQSVQHFSMFSHDYLAMANYQDDTGSTSVQSEIFKYHHKESRFVSFQRIQTYGAKDIRHFTFSNTDERRQEHFIAIANNCKRDENGQPQYWVQSTIMKFSGTRFLPFKSFYSYGALQFLPVKDGTKFFLAFADSHSLRILQYNGWTFVETFSTKFETQQLQQNSPFSIILRPFNPTSDGKTYFTVATATKQVENGMFGVSFETRNDHRKLVTSVESWCDEAKNLMRRKSLFALEHDLDSAPKLNDKRIEIKGEIKFIDAVDIGELRSQSLKMRGRSLDNDRFQQLSTIEGNFNKLAKQMSQLHDKMINNVVWTNRNDPQEIDSIVHFKHNVAYENELLNVRHLKVKANMGPILVAHHLDNLIFLNEPLKMRSIVTDNVIANDVILKKLNGHLLSDYALRHPLSADHVQIFSGNNEFLSGIQVTKEIQVGNNFAGLSFTQPEFLLYRGNQTFPGVTIELADSTVRNLHLRTLNGFDVFTMFNDAVPLSGGVIRANKRFVKGGVKIENAKVATINKIDIVSLYENAIYAKAPSATAQTFSQPVHFENLEIEGLAPSNSRINEQYNVNLDFLRIAGQKYKLNSMKLTEATSIDQLFVKKQMNNVNVLQDTDTLDLLLRESLDPQHVHSKSLKSVHFLRDVEAEELVDGVDLAGWTNEQEIVLSDNEIQGILTVTGHVTLEGGLLVGKSFMQNDFDVLKVLQNSARTDAESLPGHCDLIFDNLEVLGNSDIRGLVNNVSVKQWAINSEESTDLDITAEKEFTGSVHILKDVGAHALFGNPKEGQKRENLLTIFPKLLLDGVDQTIGNQTAFSGKFRANQASCPNTILDNVPFENLLFKKGDQTVEVETTFRQPFKAVGDVHVSGDVSAPLVDGININEHLKNTLRTNGDQVGVQRITAAWQFDTLNVMDKSEVKGALSSSSVESLYGDIIRRDSKIIQLNGVNLTFGMGALMSRVEFIGHVNGIPSTEWKDAWLLTRSDQVVETSVEFTGLVMANMFEAPSVNGVDINHLSQNILRIDKDETLGDGSPVTFTSPVATKSGIAMPNGAIVNGIDLKNNVLLKNSNAVQSVTGDKTFKNGMTVQGNMNVKKIPGFDITSFARLVNGAPEEVQSLPSSSLRIKGNLNLEHEPDATFSVNDNNWDNMLNQFWLKDQDVAIKSPVTFESLVLHDGGNMQEAAKLNDIDLKDFASNYASKTRDQKWLGDVTLENVENVEKMRSASLVLDNDGKFNGVDPVAFYNSVLRYTGDQEILASNVEADNLIVNRLHGENGGDVNINSVSTKDLMTISGENVVTAPKKLKGVKAQSVVVSKDTVIDGIELGVWDDGAVRRSGSNEIAGPVEFESLETTQNVDVDGFVDKVKLDLANVVTTEQDQVISNPVKIKRKKHSKTVKRKKGENTAVKALEGIEFQGKVNGIDVQDSISKMVFKNDDVKEKSQEPIVIKGETVFNAPVKLNEIKTESLIQGQNVTAIIETMGRAHDQVHSKGFNANARYAELLNMTKRMLAASKNRAVFLDYFVLTQTIKVPAAYVKVIRNVGYPAVAIGYKKSELITTENWWSYSAAVDYYQLQIGNRVQLEGKVTDTAELSQDSNALFAFAVNHQDNGRPAQAALEVISTNNVQNFEINKAPDKLSKTFILKSVDVGTARMRPAISQVIYGHEFKSIQSFNVATQGKTGRSEMASCLATTTEIANEMESSVTIFCMNNISGSLERVQNIQMESPSLTTSTLVPSTDATLLIILTRSDSRQPEGLLEIWSHSDKGKPDGNPTIQFKKQSCLPVFNTIALDSISTEDGKTILTVASGALRATEYQGSIFIYRYSLQTQQFKKVQTLEVSHPMDVKLQWLKPSNEIVIYVLSHSMTNNVQVYKRQGQSGWILAHQFTSENGKSLQVADFTVDGVYRAQLLVTSPTQTSIYAAEFMGVNTVIEEELMEFSHQSNSISTPLREFIDFDNL